MPRRFFAPDGANSGGIIISHGTEDGRVTLTIGGPYLHIQAEGEARGESLVRCVREALDAGLIHKNTRSLIDLTLFTGSIDWKALGDIRDMVPWGEGRETRVAYLVRNSRFAAIVRVVEVLFGRMRHHTFASREKALAWLVPEDAIEVEAQG